MRAHWRLCMFLGVGVSQKAEHVAHLLLGAKQPDNEAYLKEAIPLPW